ncbi:MAG: hypothetical protein JO318_01805 [Chloroflexi bacterium]|nr:hypothetical protein [Chloroflexota bacterium]
MQGLANADDIRHAVKTQYSQVSREPSAHYNFRVGRAFAEALGYPADLLDALPASLSEAFTVVSNAALLAQLETGQTVVDLGSGGGLDLVILARKVGPEGRAIGIDFAPDVALIQKSGLDGVRVVSRGRNARTRARESQVSVIEAHRP